MGAVGFQDIACSIPEVEIVRGGPGKDGIPALTNPEFVRPGAVGTSYLDDDDRVVGIVIDSQALAVPLNILWWHEIVNLDIGTSSVAISHCPLTGSTLGFHRSAAGGAGFGVSGLLFRNNLLMYDRRAEESLWPQMLGEARCGSADGTPLESIPVLEISWEAWRTLHPDTRVISAATGFGRDYTAYPYGSYDDPDNPSLLFPGTIDDRRPPKERVLGIPMGTGGLVFPFGALDEIGPQAVVTAVALGGPVVVFWDRQAQASMAYRPTSRGEELSFSVVGGQIRDDQTGSAWTVDGISSEGPLSGERLEPISAAFVAFWFAWPSFYPDLEIWGSF